MAGSKLQWLQQSQLNIIYTITNNSLTQSLVSIPAYIIDDGNG